MQAKPSPNPLHSCEADPALAVRAQCGPRDLAALFSRFPLALFETDRDGRCVYVNERWCQLTGQTPAEAEGEGWLAAIHPDDRARMRTAWQGSRDQPLVAVEFRVRTKAGEDRDLVSQAVAELDADGTVVGLFGAITDITERRAAEQQLEYANLIIEQSPVVLYRANAAAGFPVIYVSKNVTRFGYTVADVLSGRVRYPDYIYEQDREAATQALQRVAASGGNLCEQEYRVAAGDGSIRWIHDRTVAVRDPSGSVIALQGTLYDITERKQQEERLAVLLSHDPLTGLINRTSFSERVAAAIAELKRTGNGFAVHLLGLDHFKDINDTLGHEAGDSLLRAIAERLKSVLRRNDIVARIGGDEYAVLQTRLNEPSTSGMVATRLLGEIAKPILIDGHNLRITASIGIVVCEHHVESPSGILRDADMALNRAKDEGRNTFRVHNEEIDRAVRERVTLLEELRQALDHGELLLYYQPQFDIRDGSICGIESLVRWQHPTRGLLLPGTFIRMAEITGIIVPLGVWVLREASRQMKAWLDEGLAPPSLSVSVNLSAVQFRTGNIENDVLKALEDFDLPPGSLELEVTESVFMGILERGDNALNRLQKRGIRIAIDDFGTGYSSLAYVKRLRGTRIKIAQEFVRDIPTDETNCAVVRAVVTMAHEIGVHIVAEGVETQEQADFLRSLGCHEMQGFMFSRPLPAAAMTELLSRQCG